TTTIHWLKDRETVLGVLAVEKDQQDKVTPWVISLLSLSLARSQANQALAEVETANQLETMRSTLLASVSHDLKTPLGTIIGVATTLTDAGLTLDQEVQDELLKSIAEQGERLNRSLTKLL
ncbi:histidine kinase dimerization/phospho-acceptor domain-containing protein, partial [Vibrio anguillarum]